MTLSPGTPSNADVATRPPSGGSPGSGPPDRPQSRPSFWRRKGVLLGGSVALIIAVSVVADIPQSPTPASKRSDAVATIKEISNDIAGCSLALDEAFTIERGITRNSLTASQRKEAPGILADDANGCSYTNQSIVDLASLDISQAGTGKALNHVAAHVLDWADPDGLIAIDDIAVLLNHPHNKKALAGLRREEAQLAGDRAGALAAEHVAADQVGAALPSLGLRRLRA